MPALSRDELGKLLTVTQPSVAAGTPVTTYAYDRNRNLEVQTDARNQVTAMQWDELNRLKKRIEDGGAETEFWYDENGNETLRKDPKGQPVVSTYDTRNRLDTQTFDLAPSEPTRPWKHTTKVDYAYDENSNVTQVEEWVASGQDPPGVLFTERHFDRLDRLETETTPLPDGGSKTVGYHYFKNGLRKSIAEGGAKTAYEYDFQNRLKSVTLLAETPAAAATSYKYYADGLLREVSNPNGVKTTHVYDKADRVTSIETTRGATVVSAFAYSYYPNGNRKTQTETNGGLAETTSYGYDALNRLLTVTYPADELFPGGRTVTYGYDKVGNRTHETETDAEGAVLAEKSGDFDTRNRLTALTDLVDPTKSVAFGYDANGNLTQKTLNPSELGLDSVVTTYSYDARDLLVEAGEERTTPPAEAGGVPVVTAGVLGRFQYDFDGKRTKKIGLEGTRQYVYDDTSILAEYTSAGTAVARYDYGSDRLISLFRVDEPRKYFHFDALGSVTNLTADVTGATSASYHWDAWGNSRFASELTASKNKFGFTGYERDAETGLYNAKARYFDPQLGRFLTQDSYLGQVDSPPSLHLYQYVGNRPTYYTDPEGEAPATVIGALIGGVWGAGQAIGGYWDDTFRGDYSRSASDYLRVIGQNALAGAEIGLGIDVTLWSGGLARPIGGGLMGAGASAVTFAGRAQTWSDFGDNQKMGAGVGAALAVAPELGVALAAYGVYHGVQTWNKGAPEQGAAEVAMSLLPFAFKGVRDFTFGKGTLFGQWRGLGPADSLRTRMSLPTLQMPRLSSGGYRIGERLPDGRIAGEGPGAALRDGPEFKGGDRAIPVREPRAPVPGDEGFIGPIQPHERPIVIGKVRPYDEAQVSKIPGYENHHLDPPLGRSDPSYARGPTTPVRNDNTGGRVLGGENFHTARGGFQHALNEHIRELGYTRAQWNALPHQTRQLILRRFYASLGIPYPRR